MATRQVVKGTSAKIYDIIGNFSSGINTSVADDVVSDSTFRELINFYDDEQGALSKRPGVYDNKLAYFCRKIKDGEYDDTKFHVTFNDYEGSEEVGEAAFNKMVNIAFKGISESKRYIATSGVVNEDINLRFTPKNLMNFVITRDVNVSERLLRTDELLNGTMTDIPTGTTNFMEFIMIVGGYVSKKANITDVETSWEYISAGWAIYHVRMTLSYDMVSGISVAFEIETKDPTIKPYQTNGVFYPRWLYSYKTLEDTFPGTVIGSDDNPTECVELAKFNGYYYAATGTNYILKLKEAFSEYVSLSAPDTIQEVGGYENSNIYKPTPIELTYVGFNVLAESPIDYIDNTGVTNIVKGVFFSYTMQNEAGDNVNEPIQNVPFNKPFNIHIIHSGETAPSKFEYRPDNGETDITVNPYKSFDGTYSNETSIFSCTGLNEEGNFEIKITLGENEFINYFSTGTDYTKETGLVYQINDLVLSSTKCKIIGTQLALYGGHGYIFFSDYNRFDYFPNYYNLYIANGSNEEVTAVTYFRQFYAIFTNKQIKRMSGTFGADNFGVYPLNDFMGCSNGLTVRLVNNNLFFVGNDGLYQLKQGYLGEGTENVEKIDIMMPDVINSKNVRDAYVLGNYYIMSMTDGRTWYLMNINTNAMYHYVLSDASDDSKQAYSSIFLSNFYDEYGNFVNLAHYENMTAFNNTEERGNMDIMQFRFNDLDFLDNDLRNKDAADFVSKLETPYIHLGTPTHTKKFKAVYFKFTNKSETLIPLYITIYVDDVAVLSPEDYEVLYDDATDTYYYIYKTDSNASILEGADIIKGTRVLGELVLGEDTLGKKTIQQLKLKPNFKGRAIKFVLADGYDETVTENGESTVVKYRNNKNFTLSAIGIIYKLKKVKEG